MGTYICTLRSKPSSSEIFTKVNKELCVGCKIVPRNYMVSLGHSQPIRSDRYILHIPDYN